MTEKPGDTTPAPKPPPADDQHGDFSLSSISEAKQPEETADFRRGKPPQPIAVTPSIPKAFGRYTVEKPLGSGAFGTVYLGHDSQLDRPVAIKALRADKPITEEDLRELLQEARRVAKLRHPGIVAVHDIGVQEREVYIVSDFVQGVTLREQLRKHSFNWQETVRIVAAMADALAHAHAQRTVHRDLKPANIILAPDNKPILVDFGLGLDESEMTGQQRGLVAGTPAYMSPEQTSGQGHRIDGRTDIYSLGVILYEMLTGHVPFRAPTNRELFKQICEDEPQPPRQLVPHLPKALEQICLKALAKRIQDRYITAGDMADELNQLFQGAKAAHRPDESSIAMGMPTVSQVPVESKSGSSVQKASHRPREAERRQLTLLNCRCDLFASSEFIENLDYEEQHDVHRAYQELCARAIVEHGGAIIQMTEETTLACFGYPVAHEDAAARAVRTGLALLRELTPLRARLLQQHRIAFTSTIHVHTGMAVASDAPAGAGHEAFSVVGDARNVIARLETPDQTDAVVISQATYRLVHGYFGCEPIGDIAVKGVAKPVACFRVVSENVAQSRIDIAGAGGLTPLVGRDREVGLLQDRWEQAVEGMGQVVLIIGDAGLGKSRLIHVIKENVTALSGDATASMSGRTDSSRPIVEWRCAPHHQDSSLYPVIDFFERWLRFERDEPAESKYDKLHAHLHAVGLARDDILPHLAMLLSLPTKTTVTLSPAKQKEMTADAILECLRVYAARQPFLFIVEDLHWIDASTLELLARHVDSGFHDRILTILTFRPEFETPWKSKAHQTVMALNRLTKKQMTQLMEQKTGGAKLPAALVEQIAAKTDGVPLFVEEYTKMVMESNLRDIEGNPEISGSFIHQEIPATLQDLLMARLDRMASNREVVQIGATLGREFYYRLLKAVTPLSDGELHAELGKLVSAELLYQKGKQDDSTYLFKHALIQDAAYLSQIKSKKQQVHRRIAETMERDFKEVVESQPELLAHHFTEGAVPAQAIAYWSKAGQRAMDRFANVEAAGHLRRGLQLLAALPDTPERAGRELGMQISLGTVLIGAQGYAAPEVGPVFERARALCQQIGQPQSLLAVLWGIWAWRVVREEFDICLQLADDVLKLADSAGDDGIRMEAHFVPTLTLFYRGEFTKSLEHANVGLALYDIERCKLWSRYTGQNAGATFRSYKALAQWCLGYPDQALRTGADAAQVSRDVAHPFSQCYAIHHFGWLNYHARLGKETQELSEMVLRIAEEQGFAFWKAVGTLCRAAGLLLQDKPAEAITQLEQGLALYRATGAELSFAHYFGYFAQTYAALKRFDEALQSVDAAIAATVKNRNEFFLAELHRMKGEILLAKSNDQVSAEACFQDSLAVAERQKAKSWELRTTMSLARLWQSQDRQAEARARLAAVYGWFTEGFATPDLVDAKKMLET